jgi:uncharacterized Zn-binding protein involved in type VI secretion
MGGFPAARLTDPTVHGGMINVGCLTVLIGNLPAARIGDMHVCPLVTVIVPHVGGPLVLGSLTVIVGGVPQSRQTDMLICVGPPDTVMMGEPTVLVGMAGAAGGLGAILGAALAGLKNFFSGAQTVEIKGSPAYIKTVASDVQKFLTTPTGTHWAEAFGKTGRTITIKPIPASQTQANAFTIAGGSGAYPKKDGSPGKGADSDIEFNPSLTMQYTASDGSTQTMQPSQILGHEMIHALHNGQGVNRAANTQPPPFDNEEESQTIGVNGHDADPITERKMAGDAGQSNRPDHDSVSKMTYQDSTGDWHVQQQDAGGNWTDTKVPAPAGGGPPNR